MALLEDFEPGSFLEDDDPLVKRLKHLSWGDASDEVRQRSWEAFSRQLPSPMLTPPPPPRAPLPGGPVRLVERHGCSRSVAPVRLAVAQIWSRRGSRDRALVAS